jgi:hypothetical protein
MRPELQLRLLAIEDPANISWRDIGGRNTP